MFQMDVVMEKLQCTANQEEITVAEASYKTALATTIAVPESSVDVTSSCYRAPLLVLRSLAAVDGNLKLQARSMLASKAEVERITEITTNAAAFKNKLVSELTELGVSVTTSNIDFTVEEYASVTFPTGSPTPKPAGAESKTDLAVWLIVGILGLAALAMLFLASKNAKKSQPAVAYSDTEKSLESSSASE